MKTLRYILFALLTISGILYGGTKGPIIPPDPPETTHIWHQIPIIAGAKPTDHLQFVWTLAHSHTNAPTPLTP